MSKIDQDRDNNNIELPAICNVVNTSDLAAQIDQILSKAGRIIIDGSRVESVDFSFVQLLASAAATVGADLSRIELLSPAPCIRQAFARAGMADFPVLATEG